MALDSATTTLDEETIAAVAATIEPIPASVARLAQLVADPRTSSDQIVELVSREPRLAADVVARANTAATAGREPITTVRGAVVRLGFNTALTVALGHASRATLQTGLPQYGLMAGELWLRAVTASVAAEVIIPLSPEPVPGAAVTASLLHEIGKIAICRHFGERTLWVISAEAERRVDDVPTVERQVLGTDHAQIGAAVLRAWGLPDVIADVVADYVRPITQVGTAARVVRLAHLLGVAGTRPDQTDELWGALEQTCQILRLRCDGPDEILATTADRIDAIGRQI